MQVFREQMGIRTNGNLGVDFVTLARKMGSHLFENVLYVSVQGNGVLRSGPKSGIRDVVTPQPTTFNEPGT